MIFTIFDKKIVKKGSKPTVLYNSESSETAGNSCKRKPLKNQRLGFLSLIYYSYVGGVSIKVMYV